MRTSGKGEDDEDCMSDESIDSSSSSSSSSSSRSRPHHHLPPDPIYSQLMVQDLLSKLISGQRTTAPVTRTTTLTRADATKQFPLISPFSREDHHPFYRRTGSGKDSAGKNKQQAKNKKTKKTNKVTHPNEFLPVPVLPHHEIRDDSDEVLSYTRREKRENGKRFDVIRRVIPSSRSLPTTRKGNDDHDEDVCKDLVERGENKYPSSSCSHRNGNALTSPPPPLKHLTSLNETRIACRHPSPSSPALLSSPPPAFSSSFSIHASKTVDRSFDPFTWREICSSKGGGRSGKGSFPSCSISTASSSSHRRPVRPVSFCCSTSLFRRENSEYCSPASSVSSSNTSRGGLSSCSSIPSGVRFPVSASSRPSRHHHHRFSLIPSASFCERFQSGLRYQDEEWVSTATDLFNVSDDDIVDEEVQQETNDNEKAVSFLDGVRMRPGAAVSRLFRHSAIRDSSSSTLRSDRSTFAIDTKNGVAGIEREEEEEIGDRNHQSIGVKKEKKKESDRREGGEVGVGEEHLLVTSQFCEQMHKLLL